MKNREREGHKEYEGREVRINQGETKKKRGQVGVRSL
jgi:hypothetical protein